MVSALKLAFAAEDVGAMAKDEFEMSGSTPRVGPKNAEEFRQVQIAEMAAEKAINQTFRLLGVDLRDQKSLNDMRDDIGFLRTLRERAEQAGREARKSLYGNIGALVVGLILAVVGYWLGVHHGIPVGGGG